MIDKPSIRNAQFHSSGDITISQADAGGYIVYVRASQQGYMNQVYAACSTADETVELLRDMLTTPQVIPEARDE